MKRERSTAHNTKQIQSDFAWVERISWLMDNQFKIGGFRFGLDPLLNFIPFGGAIAGFGISLMLLFVMWRNGTSSKLIVRMLINISIDALLGAIPLLGNVFDFFSKANEKNIKLLKEHYYEEKHQGSGIWLLLFVLGSILLTIFGIIYGFWLLGEWMLQAVS